MNPSEENNPVRDNEEFDRQNGGYGEKNPEPQWYGISYQNDRGVYSTSPTPPPAGKKPGRGKRAAVIALCLALAVVLAGLAGFGGAMLANHIDDMTVEPPASSGGTPTGSLSSTIYAADGTYDYQSVKIPKNDGSALTDAASGSAGSTHMTYAETAAVVKDSVVEITAEGTGRGSGVIIHEDGIIVTNNHVIEGASKIYVRLTNGNTYEAVVRGTDADGDIALIRIDPQETLTVAKLGCSSALVVGEEVLAVGNPLGELGGTVTNGIISALEREVDVQGTVMTLLQTNAAINAGNSGGGLFNLAGELIGVVNAKYSATGVEGLGFAIPIDTAAISIDNLLQYGYIPGIPALGVTVQEKMIGNSMFTYRSVIYVYEAPEGSALQSGDYIWSIDGVEVSTLSEMKREVRRHAVGDTVSIVVVRDGRETTVQVTLTEYVPVDSSVNFDG